VFTWGGAGEIEPVRHAIMGAVDVEDHRRSRRAISAHTRANGSSSSWCGGRSAVWVAGRDHGRETTTLWTLDPAGWSITIP